MPDITMCEGGECPLKETCYRFKAKPDKYQSYFSEIPFKDNKCDYFAEIWNQGEKDFLKNWLHDTKRQSDSNLL